MHKLVVCSISFLLHFHSLSCRKLYLVPRGELVIVWVDRETLRSPAVSRCQSTSILVPFPKDPGKGCIAILNF